MTTSAADIDLSGRVAVVTGAAAGLGRAEAVGLARAGATVVVNDIAPALDRSDVLDEIAQVGAKGVAVAGDISERSTADELVETADGLGGLGIVVNNAGITRDRILFNMTDDEWDAVINVHLRGHFLLTRNAATYWRSKAKAGDGQIYGRIINTSSEAGLSGPVGQPNYGAAKAGITALTLSAARALGRFGVRANAIAPRARTAMTAGVFGDAPSCRRVRWIHCRPSTWSTSCGSWHLRRRSGQRTAVHRLWSDGDAPGGADGREAVQCDGDEWDASALSTTLQDYFADRDPEKSFSAAMGLGDRD